MQSCFFALKDTVTPTKNAAVTLVSNIILCSVLMFPMKIAGLALATSISGINSFIILFIILRKRIGDFGVKHIIVSFIKILISSCCMGLVCYFISKIELNKIVSLVLTVGAGLVSYIVFCFIFRVKEAGELMVWLRKGAGRAIKGNSSVANEG